MHVLIAGERDAHEGHLDRDDFAAAPPAGLDGERATEGSPRGRGERAGGGGAAWLLPAEPLRSENASQTVREAGRSGATLGPHG
jgi:hypothetical protein